MVSSLVQFLNGDLFLFFIDNLSTISIINTSRVIYGKQGSPSVVSWIFRSTIYDVILLVFMT